MLIERMQTHPEDFNYGGKLYQMYENKHVSARDGEALYKAHDRYIKEPNLMARVLEALLAQPEEEEEKNKVIAARAYQAGLGHGITSTTVNTVWYDETDNTLKNGPRELYELQLQTHKNALKAKPIPSKLSDIYNKALGRERVERDN